MWGVIVRTNIIETTRYFYRSYFSHIHVLSLAAPLLVGTISGCSTYQHKFNCMSLMYANAAFLQPKQGMD